MMEQARNRDPPRLSVEQMRPPTAVTNAVQEAEEIESMRG